MDSSLHQVEELVDGMVTESGVVTDQALETQSTSTTNSDGYFYVKEELQSDDGEDHPPLDFGPVSPKTEPLFETQQNQNLPIVESVVSLHQPVVEQRQNGGLSQPKDTKEGKDNMEGKKGESQKGKLPSDEREVVIWTRENTSSEVAEKDDHGLPTPCSQRIPHHDTDMEAVDDRLENIDKQHVTMAVNNIDHVNIKEEPESDDDYTPNLYQPVHTYERNMEIETSDTMTSVKLEGNGERVIDSEGRRDEMEEKKESEEVKMSMEEEEGVCQKQENSVSNIAVKTEHADGMVGKKQSRAKRTSAEMSHVQDKKKQGKFKFEVCGNITNDKSNRSQHKRRHKQENLFVCEVCGFSTKCKTTLNRHIQSHSQEKPFVCEVCGFSTKSKGRLNLHKRKHSQERRFVCEVCGYSAKWRSNLTYHARTHTQEKCFVCDVCGYSASQKAHLRRHIQSHTQEKPFTCEVCGWSTIQKSDLLRHVRKHGQEKPFVCEVCGYSTKWKSNLTSHISHKHRQE